ncbi:MAG: MGMT family protein [Gammaproteobacteria bacterium]|nr:MGMT family protein [Gammaproteobacteria bacterium]NNM12735.1 MGMT family protein [Gammaproteobacteria bacterium]
MRKPSTAFQQRFDPKIWEIVKNIPPGQVMSYGMIAERAGYPKHSRIVSPAMTRCPEALPWFRVVRSDHTLAFEVGTKYYKKQARLLRKEGVTIKGRKVFTVQTEDDLDALLWAPK